MTKPEIILVISDNTGKNVLFVLDDLSALTLKEAIKVAQKHEIAGVHLVRGGSGLYLRANPNTLEKDNLDALAVSVFALTRTIGREATFNKYRQSRGRFLDEKEDLGEVVIYVDGQRKRTEDELIKYLSKYKKYIYSAAKDLGVDPNLVGSILIDEELRRDWADDWLDWLAKLGRDTSVGIAQVKISTARGLVRAGFYPADPKHLNISPQNIDKVSGKDLSMYLNEPKHSICFVAARINQLIDRWAPYIDLSNKPEIIGTLYCSRDEDKKPHAKPKPSLRGVQIKKQFYKIAKKALRQ